MTDTTVGNNLNITLTSDQVGKLKDLVHSLNVLQMHDAILCKNILRARDGDAMTMSFTKFVLVNKQSGLEMIGLQDADINYFVLSDIGKLHSRLQLIPDDFTVELIVTHDPQQEKYVSRVVASKRKNVVQYSTRINQGMKIPKSISDTFQNIITFNGEEVSKLIGTARSAFNNLRTQEVITLTHLDGIITMSISDINNDNYTVELGKSIEGTPSFSYQYESKMLMELLKKGGKDGTTLELGIQRGYLRFDVQGVTAYVVPFQGVL